MTMPQGQDELEPTTTETVDTVVSEEEFRPLFIEAARPLLHLEARAATHSDRAMTRRMYATITEEASDLENLLEDHDARYNSAFAPALELIASLRVFASVGYTLKTLLSRHPRKIVLEDADEDAHFRIEAAETLRFVNRNVRILMKELRSDVEDLCDDLSPEGAPTQITAQESIHRLKLPHTLGADETEDTPSRIATEAAHFLSAYEGMTNRAECRKFDDQDEMERFVLEVCDEEQSRFLEAKLQNIQSRYDTFVKNTRLEREDDDLRRFRYCVGMALRLSRCVTQLVHFYERHEDVVRTEEVRDRVATLVDKRRVLANLLNFGLYYVYRFMQCTEPVAKRLLDRYTTSRTVTLAIPENVYIHARPAALITKIVNHHGTPVSMTIGGDSCYAGSITKVMLLAGSQHAVREVTFTGDAAPIGDLERLFEGGLGETDALPEDLTYLR